MMYRVHPNDLYEDAFHKYIHASVIALDLETTGLDFKTDRIATCQLYIPGEPIDIIVYDSCTVATVLNNLFADYRGIWLIHHAPFDISFIYSDCGVVLDNVVCTKIASKFLDPEGKHGLQDLIRKYYGVEIDKTRRENPNWKNLTNEDYKYMCRDVIFLPGIYAFQQTELVALGRLSMVQAACWGLPNNLRQRILGIENVYGY